jgi:cytochrome c oxidase assembly factor 7
MLEFFLISADTMSVGPIYDLKDPEEAEEYLTNVGIEYRFQCFHEKIPDGCHRLGDFLEAVRRDDVRARKIFKENCEDNQHGHSCFKYGQHNMLGTGGPKDHYEAYSYFVKGCDATFGPSCHNAGLLHHLGRTHKTDTVDFVKTAEFMKRGCELNNLSSCHFLSTYYITGKPNLPQDLPQAFKLAKKACEAGHMFSCVNLSIMYKRGEGVDQDLKLSKQYEKFAQKLHKDQFEKSQTIKFGE